MSVCLSVCLFVRHAHYSGVLSPFGKPEVSLELYRRGHSIFQISKNFTQFSRNFGYFSHFWANFYMLGIKMHVLELRNSLVILSKNFTRVFTQFHAIFTQFHTILAILAIFGPISTCWVSKCMYSS